MWLWKAVSNARTQKRQPVRIDWVYTHTSCFNSRKKLYKKHQEH
jgi:hypothetical protein